MFKSLRLQLTAGYLASFAALLLLFCLFLYSVLARSLGRRLDEGLLSEARTVASLMKEELGEMGGDALPAAEGVIEELPESGRAIGILKGLQVLATTDPGRKAALASAAATINEDGAVGPLPKWGKHGARGAAAQVNYEGEIYTILAAEPLDSIVQSLQVLRETLALAVPLMLGLAGIGGYWLTRRGLAPLGWMVAQTRKITGDSLDQRLEIGNAAEELATLAASFNELLSRLDQSFESMRRFVQDASHELRTPLAVIRGEADIALSQERHAAEYRESLAIIHEEARRLSRLVDDLLNLARADAGHVQLRVEELYLNDLLAECCRSVQPLAGGREIELTCSAAEDVAFRGDEELLRRMVVNLLDNAIRYTPPGGKVSASLEAIGSHIRIRVADTGVGITAEASKHVFERFFRADQARSRQNGGFGLGLAIVKWIAESHHGAVELTSQPGSGTTITVRLERRDSVPA
jgi:heavy metal sensor kinase